MQKPHFLIKNKFQKKSDLYEDLLTTQILGDVCHKITGQCDFTVDFDNTGYNKGRLAILEFGGEVHYISFSEMEVRSRNSFFQSFPSALVNYHQQSNPNKFIYFYLLRPDGPIETSYFIFMYRLMKTTGTIFLNESQWLSSKIIPFVSVSDIIAQRDINRSRNRGNASTYVTIDENDVLQIFGKTFGANKYETTLLTLAIFGVTEHNIEVYEIQEGNLTKLPADARNVIISLGIRVITSDLTVEREQFEKNDSLRSPTYLYNLLEKLGDKKCAVCECEIPQIIQGAHIWPVASIKKANNLSLEVQMQHATDGDNGLWLCNNHHKLLDIKFMYISQHGRLYYASNVIDSHEEFFRDSLSIRQLSPDILTPKFLQYLEKRNSQIDESLYSLV